MYELVNHLGHLRCHDSINVKLMQIFIATKMDLQLSALAMYNIFSWSIDCIGRLWQLSVGIPKTRMTLSY